MRRLAAGVSAVALALMGTVSFASSASAAPAGFPVPDQTGSLTLHKHVRDASSTDGNPAGAPLAGVVFAVQQVGVTGAGCTAIDLTTPAGWASVQTAIAGFNDTTGALPTGFCLVGSPTSVTTLASGQTPALSGLRGLYRVMETSAGPNLVDEAAAPFLVTVPMPVAGTGGNADSWDYSVDAYPKNTLTTITPTKTVGATNTSVVPGAVVPWTVTAPVPVAPFAYSNIAIADVPATGHTFTAFTSIALNGTALLPADYTVSGSTISLTGPGLTKVNALVTGAGATAATITVNLTTTVTGTVLGELTNSANVTLNGTTTSTTSPTAAPPKTVWGKLSVLKHVAGSTTTGLDGAEFAVYAKTGATCDASVTGTPVATGTTAAGGVWEQVLWIANAQGEAAGPFTAAYCLVETAAPAGYVLDPAPREITLSSAAAGVTTSYQFPNTQVIAPALPLTGAEGTALFTMAGLALVAIAGGGFLIRRARANH